MSCTTVDDGSWMRAFNKRAFSQRIPVSGMLELTSRCNLRCVHCYLGSQEEQHKKRALEMDTERVKGIIDEMAAAGCMFLVITGGDPMMRKDFPEIFIHAKSKGMFITVFCDGVLVTEKIVELFKEWPPRTVEISIYGATAETYEKVTRIPGSYAKCIRGIERLLDAGIDVALKTVLMTINEHELGAMREIARSYGCKFRFDSAIFPCLPDSSKDPLELRVDPKRAVEHEMADERVRDGWIQYHETRKNNPPKETLFRCGAGLTSFHVGPLGELSPCVMTTQYRYPSNGATFQERWDNELRELRSEKPKRSDYECNSCEKRTLCSGCPAFNWLESGESDKKSNYVCATTQARWDAVFGDENSSPGHRALKIVK